MAADSYSFFTLGDFELGNPRLLHQVDQCLDFSQVHCLILSCLPLILFLTDSRQRGSVAIHIRYFLLLLDAQMRLMAASSASS